MIVTHQKRTMEIAGMMYGVSLSKDGTTKVVCQQMETEGSRRRPAGRQNASVPRRRLDPVLRRRARALYVPESEPVH